MKFYRVKDIATYLMEVSLDTGYDYDFLCKMVDELMEDGDTYEGAISYVSNVSYEFDW